MNEFEIRLDQTTDYGVSCPWASKMRYHFFSIDIDRILFKFAGNEDMHNILAEFEFRQDRTTTMELAALDRPKKIPLPYNEEKVVIRFSRLFLIQSFSFMQVMRMRIHKSLDEFEFRPYPTTDYRVSCPCVMKK